MGKDHCVDQPNLIGKPHRQVCRNVKYFTEEEDRTDDTGIHSKLDEEPIGNHGLNDQPTGKSINGK